MAASRECEVVQLARCKDAWRVTIVGRCQRRFQIDVSSSELVNTTDNDRVENVA